MKRLLLLFVIFAMAVAANASIKFYDENKEEITEDEKLDEAVYVVIDNFANGDYNALNDARKTKFSQMEKVVFTGTSFNENEWNNTVKNQLQHSKEYDFSAFNADFYNHLGLFSDKCSGPGSVITLPDNQDVPGDKQLYQYIKCEILVIPNHVTKVAEGAFKQNGTIKEVYLGSGLKEIQKEAFMGMKLEEVYFTRGIINLTFGSDIFKDNPNLKHANIPEGVENLGDGMFMNCKNLESVRIPSTVQHIGANCFSDCQLLTQITIPEAAGNSPQSIGQNAFNNCTALGDIYVMARTVDKIPLIVSAPIAAGSDGGTFGNTLVNANGHNPATGIVNQLQSNEVSDYYTTNHCMKLHYPAGCGLRDFYDYNPYEEWDMANDPAFKNLSDEEKAKRPAKYLSNTYLMPDAQYLAQRTSQNNNEPGYHPIPNGNVWPSHEQGQNNREWRFRRENYTDSDYPNEDLNNDYNRRNRAGYANGMSNVGWRQLKVMEEYTPGVDVVERVVDDTWYTMCYPFNLTDEQLEECFSSGYNIVEFSDARIVKMKDDPTKKAMVLYFTDIAATHYIDDENNIYYSDKSLKPAGAQYRKYKRFDSETNTDVTYEYVNELSGDVAQARVQAKYQNIHGTLAFAGHPYMVHPNVGVVKGETFSDGTVMNRVKGYLSGVKALTEDKYQPNVDTATGKWHLNGDGKERDLTQPGAKPFTKDGLDIQTQVKIELMDCTEDVNNGTPTGGYMTFVGKVVPTGENDEARGITQKIPMNAYFLGNVSDERYGENTNPMNVNKKYYPRFYRRVNANATYNNWTQYTAVILPDNPAQAKLMSDVWDETDDGADVSLNDFGNIGNPGDVTSIQEVLQEAKEKNMPVEYMDVIFNIRGQEVKRGSTDLQNLPTGVYIVNGKKYFVK